MIPLQIDGARPSRVFAVVLAALALVACSSDPPTPLGSDNDLASSTPGVVSSDTLALSEDSVLAYYTPIAADDVLEFGRPASINPVPEYQRSMVIQVGWSGASADTLKTVLKAQLRLTVHDLDAPFPARFYQLADAYNEGESIEALDTLSVIVDPSTNSPNRTLQTVPREYELPSALVQGWIREDIERTAIAIVYTDDVSDRIATFLSTEAANDRPALVVDFVGGTSRSYSVSSDATFVRPTANTSNLIISDGYVRRIYFKLPLDQLGEHSAVHSARVRLYLVPGSTLGSAPNLIVFIPASSDPTDDKFKDGQLVTTVIYQPSADYVEFTMTNAIALMLQGTLENNGVVVRYDAENTQVRQVEFYDSSAPEELRPRLFITTSTPAEFDPGEEP